MFNYLIRLFIGNEEDTTSIPFRRKALKQNIEEYENEKILSDNWKVNLTVIIDLLKMVDNDLLGNDDLALLKSINIYSGFKDIKHLTSWFTLVRFKIENRELPLTSDVLYIPRERKTITLWNFLNHKLRKACTVSECRTILLEELTQLKIVIDTINDYRDKDRIESNLSGTYRDIFSIVEAIITVGVTNRE